MYGNEAFTFTYRCPELLEAGQEKCDIGAESDVYALGCDIVGNRVNVACFTAVLLLK